MIKFACPQCGNGLSAPENKAGSLSNCPACASMVQVPAPQAGGDSPPRRRETLRAFWALVRLFLWGVCFAVVLLAVVSYFLEFEKKIDDIQKVILTAQHLVYILGAYYVARTFEDTTKSLEELCARIRRRR
jgi:hypothetical protein